MKLLMLAAAFCAVVMVAASGGFVQAQATEPTTCGKYTVKISAAGADRKKLQLIGPNQTVAATLEEADVGTNWCRDVTGDGVPEFLVYQFTGGAHCCFEHTLYSLTVPPKTMLETYSAHSDTIRAQQLDGRGPLELLGADWRFAYGFGLCFACSPVLPIVYNLQDGVYVEDTRNYPGIILGSARFKGAPTDPGELLAGVASLLVVGKEIEAKALIQLAPKPMRDWIKGYLPDIRQSISDYGMADWPRRSALSLASGNYVGGVGGSFSAAKVREFTAMIPGPNPRVGIRADQVGLVKFTASGAKIIASQALLTLPKAKSGETFDVKWWPMSFVTRAGGRDDLIVRDAISGTPKFIPYRLENETSIKLEDDALVTFMAAITDLSTVAQLHARLGDKSANRTAEQLATLAQRVQAAETQAKQWADDLQTPIENIAVFNHQAVEVLEDGEEAARIRATVQLGTAEPQSAVEYGPSTRYAFIADLTRGPDGWEIKRISIQRLTELVPN